MKNLIEIAGILTRNRLKKIEVLTNTVLNKKGHMLSRMYNGIINKQFSSDKDAARSLYNTHPSDGRYTRLKSEFKKRLLNNLYYLDINAPSFSNYNRALHTCHKNLTLIRILATNSARNAAVDLAIQTLNQAQKYTFTDVALICVRFLKDNAAITGNIKLLKYYRALIKKYQEILNAEMQAEDWYQDLIIHYTNSISTKSELGSLADNYKDKLKKLAGTYHSYTLQYFMYRIWALSHEIKGSYHSTLKVYRQFEEYLDKHPVFKRKSLTGKINIYKMNCFIHLNDFKNGELTAISSIKLFEKNNINRYAFLEYYFLLAMRTGKYVKAKEIFNEVIYSSKFPAFSEDRKEKWRIYEAYLNFILANANIDPDLLGRQRTRRFNILKFLNEVPNLSKDKRGYNIAILIIHILFMLQQGNHNAIIDRTTALQVYRNRYLKREEDIRSKLFIKMILIMDKEFFEHEKTKQKTEKYLDQLAKARYTYEGSPMDAEVVPYETLWSMVLKILKEQGQ